MRHDCESGGRGMSVSGGATLENSTELVDRMVSGAERAAAVERAAGLPQLELDQVAISDLELLGVGGYSPLSGFVGQADYRSIVDDMRLASGQPWSLPITLGVDEDQAARLRDG